MMNRTFKLIAINSTILVALLLILEVTLRFQGHNPFSKGPKPEISVNPGGKYYQKDSLLGYKHITGKYQIKLKQGYEFAVQHDSNTRRITHIPLMDQDVQKPEIWIFGCSLTYGFSINDHETFPWRLQSKLSEYEFINWGVNGYGTLQFYLQLKQALLTNKKPDLVIVNHADFHHERNSFSYNYRSAISKLNFLGKMNRPYAELSDDDKLRITYSDVEYLPWKWSKWSALSYLIEKKYENFLDGRMHWQNLKITSLVYDEIVDLCDINKVELLIANIDLDPGFINGYCSENEIPFVDISVDRSLKEYNNQPFDKHPNARANKVYADTIYSYLSDNYIDKD